MSRVRDPADDGAWREFDARYRDLILRYCRGRGLQATDAEDVRQLVMMSLARAMRGFRYRREVGRFRNYLGRVVRNAISNYVSCPTSAARPLRGDDLDLLPSDDDESIDSRWEQEWVGHHFRSAMRKAKKAFDPQSLLIFEQLLAGARGVRKLDRLAGPDLTAAPQGPHHRARCLTPSLSNSSSPPSLAGSTASKRR